MSVQKTSNFKNQTSDNIQTTNNKQVPFDLEERMTKFSENIVIFCRELQVDHVSRPVVSQLVRSATSIGANYAEANNSSSKKDFRNKIHISKKEAQETKYWLRILEPCFLNRKAEIKQFWGEAHEFVLILQSIANKVDGRMKV